MKEHFAKIKESLNETMELLKTKKFDEAIENFSKTIDELETAESEALAKSEELEKVKKEWEDEKVELVKIKEDMKKWADMYISADNVAKLLEDLKAWFKQDMTKITEEFEEFKKTSLGSKQMVKTVWEDEKWGLFDNLMPN